MAYVQHTWQPGELATAAKLNNIEDGISESFDLTSTLITGTLAPGNGGTGLTNLKDLQVLLFKQLSQNAESYATLSVYPKQAGVYRVGVPISGLPSGATGYGPLLIVKAGDYWLHIYMDNNSSIYIARSGDTGVPSTWYKMTCTAVSSA